MIYNGYVCALVTLTYWLINQENKPIIGGHSHELMLFLKPMN